MSRILDLFRTLLETFSSSGNRLPIATSGLATQATVETLATETTLAALLEATDTSEASEATQEALSGLLIKSQDTTPPLLGDSGEALTRDVGLASLLGSNPLLAPDGGVKTTGRVAEMRVSGALNVIGQSLICYCSGYPTVGLQLSGTFTGTVTFEASVDGANWVGVFGVPVAGGALAASTTAVGAWLISVAGCTAVRARASAAVTGAATAVFVASAAVARGLQSAGSLAALSQKATSLELNTYDTNLVAVFGTASLARNPATDIAIGPVAPPARTAAQLLAAPTWTQGMPNYFPRVRVEAGGSERLPLRQEPNTLALVVASDDIRRQLETVSVQLAQLTDALAAAGLLGGGYNAR